MGINPFDYSTLDPTLARILQESEHPRITSGTRSAARNRAAGGVGKSRHLHGDAVDLDLSQLSIPERIELLNRYRDAGVRRFGIYSDKDILHMDMSDANGPNHYMFDKTIKNIGNAPEYFRNFAKRKQMPTQSSAPDPHALTIANELDKKGVPLEEIVALRDAGLGIYEIGAKYGVSVPNEGPMSRNLPGRPEYDPGNAPPGGLNIETNPQWNPNPPVEPAMPVPPAPAVPAPQAGIPQSPQAPQSQGQFAPAEMPPQIPYAETDQLNIRELLQSPEYLLNSAGAMDTTQPAITSMAGGLRYANKQARGVAEKMRESAWRKYQSNASLMKDNRTAAVRDWEYYDNLRKTKGQEEADRFLQTKHVLENIPNVNAAAAARKFGEQLPTKISDAKKVLDTVPLTYDALKRTNRKIAKIFGSIDDSTTGLAVVLNRLPGSTPNDMRVMLESLKSDTALTAMQSMKEASPTGATGLGPVDQKELSLLINSIESFDQSASPELQRDAMAGILESFMSVQTQLESKYQKNLDFYRQYNTEGPGRTQYPSTYRNSISDYFQNSADSARKILSQPVRPNPVPVGTGTPDGFIYHGVVE